LLERVVTKTVTSPMMISGCDPILQAEGTVYEWVEPPREAESRIIIGQGVPPGIQVEPLEGVHLYLWERDSYRNYRRNHDRDQGEESVYQTLGALLIEVNSDGGDFYLRDPTYDQNHGALGARKEGCDSVEMELPDYFNKATTIILVCTKKGVVEPKEIWTN
jgi:hypothetical protein